MQITEYSLDMHWIYPMFVDRGETRRVSSQISSSILNTNISLLSLSFQKTSHLIIWYAYIQHKPHGRSGKSKNIAQILHSYFS